MRMYMSKRERIHPKPNDTKSQNSAEQWRGRPTNGGLREVMSHFMSSLYLTTKSHAAKAG